MGDTESCASVWMPRMRTKKVEVYHEIVRKLRESQNEEAAQPGFEDDLWSHFDRLPMSYAIDVNLETPEEVLMHKKLLNQAPTRPAIEVQLVEVHSTSDVSSSDSVHSTIGKVDPQTYDYPGRQSIHPPFASCNPELALEVNKSNGQAGTDGNLHYSGNLYEITISTVDKPKLLSQLTSLLSKIGLNIQEAHAFSTTDGYSLDVFSVDGWAYEDAEQLRHALLGEIPKIERLSGPKHIRSPGGELPQTGSELGSDNIPIDGIDAVEIDPVMLKFGLKIAAGSYGDLYRGTFRSQEVAIKLFKAEYLSEGIQKEFAQEVFIMRIVQHENVVQFIGACTRPPTLCIVTEFMSGGSVYDFMHKQKGIFKLPALLKVAIDVSKGMKYLHHRNIIHRDLKAANLLMDGNEVVKVADFGVARVQMPGGVMTAETGTYRWMAPEVIEHKPYDRKADVFSFGIVLWELLTGKLPYEDMTPLQAAVGVVQKGLRPSIPSHTYPKMVQLLERCWHQDPSLRPEFSELIDILEHMLMEVAVEERNCKRRTHLAETSEMADKQAVKSQVTED